MNVMAMRAGILGATSLVGQVLLSRLSDAGWDVVAYSRKAHSPSELPGVEWRTLSSSETGHNGGSQQNGDDIHYWICAAPIWVLPGHFSLLKAHGARRVVALSSTSRFTKSDSSSDEEKMTAFKLSEAETRLEEWARQQAVEWMILRPTLIYGFGQDKNISELIRLIRRFRFFPLPGDARGLRQPVHADDVAAACFAALQKFEIANCAYNLSGGETLTYREMLARIFTSLGLRPRLVVIPPQVLRLLQTVLRLFPRYQRWNKAMVDRMNADLVFDHTDARRDLNFRPRTFQLTWQDVPKK